MVRSRVEVARYVMERINEGQIEAALELVAPDFVVEVPPSMSAEPDTYEGHAGVRRYFGSFEGLMDDVRFEALEWIEEGDAVIVRMLLKGRGTASGIDVELPAVTVHWVEDGKLKRIEPYPDLEAARAALRSRSDRPDASRGLTPPDPR